MIQVRLEPRADTPAWLAAALPLLAILAALALCSTLIMLAGANVIDAYRALFTGAAGSRFNIVGNGVKAAPRGVTGLQPGQSAAPHPDPQQNERNSGG